MNRPVPTGRPYYLTRSTISVARGDDWSASEVEPEIGSPSPWGRIHHVNHVAKGIVCVSTASHGGWWLAGWRWDRLDPRAQAYCRNWADGSPQWAEEDCAIAFIVDAFPDDFADDVVDRAREMIRAIAPRGDSR